MIRASAQKDRKIVSQCLYDTFRMSIAITKRQPPVWSVVAVYVSVNASFGFFIQITAIISRIWLRRRNNPKGVSSLRFQHVLWILTGCFEEYRQY